MRVLLVLLVTVMVAAAERPVLDDPGPMPDDQAFAVVVIRDVPELIAKLDAMAALFMRAGRQERPLGQALERILGADGGGLLGGGPALIVVGPGGVVPAVAVVLPTAEPDRLGELLRGRRMQHVAVVEDALVLAAQANGLALGQRLAGQRAALAMVDSGVDVRVLCAPERILTAYEPMITPGIGMLKTTMEKQPEAALGLPILLAEIAAARWAIADIDMVRLDLGFEPTTITADCLVAAIPGSALAEALQAPVVAHDALAQRFVAKPATFVMLGSINSSALCAWLAECLLTVRAEPLVEEWVSDELIAQVEDWGGFWDGSMASRLSTTATGGMDMAGAFGLRDPEAYHAALRAMMTALFSEGPLADMYAAMGIQAALRENTRHVGEVAVTLIDYHVDEAVADPALIEQLRSAMRDVEVATPAGCAVMAQDPAELDALIIAGQPVLTTHAQQAIGPGRDGTWDMAVIALLRDLLRSQPANPMQGMVPALEALPAETPQMGAWTARDGRVLLEGRIALQPFADLTKAARERFGGGRGGQQAPPPEPAGASAEF